MFMAWLPIQAVPAATEIYLPLGASGQVQVVEGDTDRVAAVIQDVGNAHGLAITPDLRYLVAGSYTETVLGRKRVPPKPGEMSEAEHQRHHQPAADSRGTEQGTSHISIIDTSSKTVVRRIAVQGAVHHVAVSPNGRVAVATHPGKGGVSIIDLRQYQVLQTLATGRAPNYVAFSPDGRLLYVSNYGDDEVSVIDVESWVQKHKISTGDQPGHMILSVDGRTLYVNNVGDGTVSVIPLAGKGAGRTYTVGASPHGVALSDDGKSLFVSSQEENYLLAINLLNGAIRRLALGPAPYHVTALGDGKLYVSSRAKKMLWVVDQGTLAVRKVIELNGIAHQMAVAVHQ